MPREIRHPEPLPGLEREFAVFNRKDLAPAPDPPQKRAGTLHDADESTGRDDRD